jgi:ribosomal protein S18 acetylase RimI-like enzyme
MFRRTYGDDLIAIVRPNPDTRKGEEVKAFCARTPECCLICEERGRIVGFVTFRLDRERRIGQIGDNAVDPDCGLKGKGQEMYRAVLDRFRQEGMLYARVSTGMDEAHARARRAYERVGFNIHHEVITYYMEL